MSYTAPRAYDKPGYYIPPNWGQRAWRPKLAANIANNAATRPTIAVVGDSVSQGYHCSNPITKSWPGLMRIALQAVGGDGGFGYWPASFADVAVTALAGAQFTSAYSAVSAIHTTAGSPVWTRGSQGPGNQIVVTSTPGNTLTTCPIRGTTLEYFVIEQGAGATYTYSVDGGTAVPITPGGTTQVVRRSITGLSAGNHTVVFSYTGSTTPFAWCGIRGLNAAGVVVDNYSRYGAASSNYIEATGLGWNGGPGGSGGSQTPADLMIVSLGLNDGGAAITGDTWAKNLRLLIANALDYNTTAAVTDVMIVMQHVGKNDNANSLYQDYVSRARTVGEAFGAAVIDVWTAGRNSWNYWNNLGYWGNTATPGAAGTDNVHLSDAGQQAVWNLVQPVVMATA